MRRETGLTLVELLAVLALIGIVVAGVAVGSFAWIRQQASQSTVFHVQALLQSARAEAVARNRACRFVIQPATRTVCVFDLNDPGDAYDDVEVTRMRLSSAAAFQRPDSGNAVTLPEFGAGVHEATFESDGTVSSGAGGEIVLWGGKTYHRVRLYGAGGVRVERWANGSWTTGL